MTRGDFPSGKRSDPRDIRDLPQRKNYEFGWPIIPWLVDLHEPLEEKGENRTLTEFIASGWLVVLMLLVGLCFLFFMVIVLAPTFPLWYPFYWLGGKFAKYRYRHLLEP